MPIEDMTTAQGIGTRLMRGSIFEKSSCVVRVSDLVVWTMERSVRSAFSGLPNLSKEKGQKDREALPLEFVNMLELLRNVVDQPLMPGQSADDFKSESDGGESTFEFANDGAGASLYPVCTHLGRPRAKLN
jgi:hypothetical protein